MDLGRSISLGGVTVSPDLNIATNIFFQPLDKHGKQALVVPDFGMVAKEINPVLQKMRAQGWRIGCLYNQETDENPQLYWSHMWKVGAPEQLAQEIRNGRSLRHEVQQAELTFSGSGFGAGRGAARSRP